MANNENDSPKPWERREGETARQYEAFCIYRDLGASRSQNKTCEKLSKSRQVIGKWSSMNNWVDRAVKWDAEQDRLMRIEQQKEIAKMRKKHAKVASDMIEKALEALKNMRSDELSPADIAKFVSEATKVERISRGDVGDVIEEREAEEKAAPPVVFYIPDNQRD